jgi:hypothetical protein
MLASLSLMSPGNKREFLRRLTRARVTNQPQVCYTFVPRSGVVQLVARQPLELVILVRVQAPEPPVS